MKLRHGESYLWLLPLAWGATAVLAVPIAALTGNLQNGVLAFPACVVLFTLYEIWSGVALDSWWRASHPRGTGAYYGLIVWQLCAPVVFTIFFLSIE